MSANGPIVVVFDLASHMHRESVAHALAAILETTITRTHPAHNPGVDSWWIADGDLKHVDGNDNLPMKLVEDLDVPMHVPGAAIPIPALQVNAATAHVADAAHAAALAAIRLTTLSPESGRAVADAVHRAVIDATPASVESFTIADNAVGLFLENRGMHGMDEATARAAATLEVAEGAAGI